MRSFLSSLIGLSMIIATFFVGGAYNVAPTAQAPPPSALPAIALVDTFASLRTVQEPVSASWDAPQILDPTAEQNFNQYFGCEPPLIDSVCVFQKRGIGHLIPTQPASAEDWRQLVAVYFPTDHVDRAIEVMQCESGGNPNAKNPISTASGLFQHLHSLWGPRVAKAGWGDGSIWDPQTNIAVAAWLVTEGGGWRHWNASRHCWG
jgi:hypothetical protein